jgi:hypothetical protein
MAEKMRTRSWATPERGKGLQTDPAEKLGRNQQAARKVTRALWSPGVGALSREAVFVNGFADLWMKNLAALDVTVRSAGSCSRP